MNAVRPHVGRLCERVIEKALRDEVFKNLPRRKDIAAGHPVKIEIDVGKIVAEETVKLEALLGSGELQTIIANYPVRETPALDQISDRLGFKGRPQYEAAVRKLLMEDEEALAMVRSMFGGLQDELNGGGQPASSQAAA